MASPPPSNDYPVDYKWEMLPTAFWSPNHSMIALFSPYGSEIANQHIHLDSPAARGALSPQYDFTAQRTWMDYSGVLRALLSPPSP